MHIHVGVADSKRAGEIEPTQDSPVFPAEHLPDLHFAHAACVEAAAQGPKRCRDRSGRHLGRQDEVRSVERTRALSPRAHGIRYGVAFIDA